MPDNKAIRWGKTSTSNFIGAKIKPLCWLKQPRFEVFSNLDYLNIIILSNAILGNRDSRLRPAEAHRGPKKGLGCNL